MLKLPKYYGGMGHRRPKDDRAFRRLSAAQIPGRRELRNGAVEHGPREMVSHCPPAVEKVLFAAEILAWRSLIGKRTMKG